MESTPNLQVRRSIKIQSNNKQKPDQTNKKLGKQRNKIVLPGLLTQTVFLNKETVLRQLLNQRHSDSFLKTWTLTWAANNQTLIDYFNLSATSSVCPLKDTRAQ